MDKSLPIYVVDVFANRLFSGNPAAVIPLDSWLDDALMQQIAQENNQAETAFLVPLQNDWHIRWFTPTTEVNLCGHATIASAHVLRTENGKQQGAIRFFSRSGWLEVKHGDHSGYCLDMPSDKAEPYDPPPFLFEALGTDVVEFYKGREDFLAVVEDSARLRTMKPDFSLIKRLNSRGLLVTAPDHEFDFVSRCFFPQTGVDEDPATGSAHCTLTQYWHNKTGRTSFKAYQASQRGAIIHCRLEHDRILLEGNALTYLKGRINLE